PSSPSSSVHHSTSSFSSSVHHILRAGVRSHRISHPPSFCGIPVYKMVYNTILSVNSARHIHLRNEGDRGEVGVETPERRAVRKACNCL
ncbi:unnamed protein product, partial [Ascophyllum nodosum]